MLVEGERDGGGAVELKVAAAASASWFVFVADGEGFEAGVDAAAPVEAAACIGGRGGGSASPSRAGSSSAGAMVATTRDVNEKRPLRGVRSRHGRMERRGVWFFGLWRGPSRGGEGGRERSEMEKESRMPSHGDGQDGTLNDQFYA